MIGGADMAAVFVYFFFIGAGTAAGVGVVAWIGWKIVARAQRKQSRKAAF